MEIISGILNLISALYLDIHLKIDSQNFFIGGVIGPFMH